MERPEFIELHFGDGSGSFDIDPDWVGMVSRLAPGGTEGKGEIWVKGQWSSHVGPITVLETRNEIMALLFPGKVPKPDFPPGFTGSCSESRVVLEKPVGDGKPLFQITAHKLIRSDGWSCKGTQKAQFYLPAQNSPEAVLAILIDLIPEKLRKGD